MKILMREIFRKQFSSTNTRDSIIENTWEIKSSVVRDVQVFQLLITLGICKLKMLIWKKIHIQQLKCSNKRKSEKRYEIVYLMKLRK